MWCNGGTWVILIIILLFCCSGFGNNFGLNANNDCGCGRNREGCGC